MGQALTLKLPVEVVLLMAAACPVKLIGHDVAVNVLVLLMAVLFAESANVDEVAFNIPELVRTPLCPPNWMVDDVKVKELVLDIVGLMFAEVIVVYAAVMVPVLARVP